MICQRQKTQKDRNSRKSISILPSAIVKERFNDVGRRRDHHKRIYSSGCVLCSFAEDALQ